MNRPASLISAIFLLLIALSHVLRILIGVQVVANGTIIPMWPSIVAVVVPAFLGLWLLNERRTPPR